MIRPAQIVSSSLSQIWRQVAVSPMAARLIHGSLWTLAGSVIARMLALMAALCVARILGKAVYGELGVVQTTIGMFGTIAGFGMGTTASKFVAEFRHKDPTKAGRIIALSSLVSWSMGLVLSAALWLLAPWLGSVVLGSPDLISYVRLSAPLLLLSAVNGAQNGVLSGFEAFRKTAWINGLIGVASFPLVVGGAMIVGLPGVLGGMIAAQAIGCVANRVAWRQEAARLQIPIVSWRGAQPEAPVLWRFAIPAALGAVLVGGIDWGCTALLAREPSGFEQVGALSVANQWFGAVLWLPYVIAQAVMPILSERIGADDVIRSSKVLLASVRMSAAVTLPVVILGTLASRQIMSAYGDDFTGDWPTLTVSLFTCLIVAIQVPAGNMIAASGRMWLGFRMNLLWGTVFLSMTWLLVKWGALGLASARLAAYTAQGCWACFYVMIWMRRQRCAARLI